MLNQIFQILGHQPTATTQARTTYKSPFNPSEKTPSCYIFNNNKWDGIDPLKEFNYKDNSSGHGGDVYHFMMNYFNLSFTGAKAKITELTGLNNQEHHRPTQKKLATALNEKQKSNPSFSFNQQKETYKIIKTSTLQNKALVDYLSERGISKEISERYLGEIYYQIDNKNYFALSFGNDSGGREVRNKYFKGSFGKKDISLILSNPKDRRLKYFEGFVDFLSYLEINRTAPLSNYLILNSVSLKERALIAIRGKFEAHELYLDNDRAGNEATDFFMENLQNVTDKRVHYKEHKDLNEFHLYRRG